MGPMYHLLNEKDRTSALNAAITLLKDKGLRKATNKELIYVRYDDGIGNESIY